MGRNTLRINIAKFATESKDEFPRDDGKKYYHHVPPPHPPARHGNGAAVFGPRSGISYKDMLINNKDMLINNTPAVPAEKVIDVSPDINAFVNLHGRALVGRVFDLKVLRTLKDQLLSANLIGVEKIEESAGKIVPDPSRLNVEVGSPMHGESPVHGYHPLSIGNDKSFNEGNKIYFFMSKESAKGGAIKSPLLRNHPALCLLPRPSVILISICDFLRPLQMGWVWGCRLRCQVRVCNLGVDGDFLRKETTATLNLGLSVGA
ncbi:hypothetical protein L1987_66136 [Smallanthus sonchifolius]|uniref:Uncharacterized protein n=1 Tax=Smallanthus sonchifolius TaxID=185202 RepID=A0ACB9BWN4_9ASTR|nr:hypothetical protein L1987_66136 [Smallanthus sonchifolius]